jgi:hypothetical protein
VRWSCAQRQHNAASFTTPHVVSLLCLIHSRVVCMCALWDCMAQPDCGEGLCPVVQVCDLDASTPSCFQAQQLRSKRSESFCSVLSARLTYDVGVSAGRSAGHACVCAVCLCSQLGSASCVLVVKEDGRQASSGACAIDGADRPPSQPQTLCFGCMTL